MDLQKISTILTILATIISASFYLYKYYQRSRNPSITITTLKKNRYPISYVTFNGPNGERQPKIERIGLWLEINIVNNSDRPLLLEQIECYEDDCERNPIYNTPFKHLLINEDKVTVEDPLNFIIKIDAHSSLHFFCMGEVRLASKLATKIFEKLNIKYNIDFINNLQKIKESIIARNKKAIEMWGIKVTDLTLEEVSSHLPTENSDGSKIYYSEILGVLPSTGLINKLMDWSTDFSEYNELIKSPYKKFTIKFNFIGNKTCEKILPINHSLWFTEYFN